MSIQQTRHIAKLERQIVTLTELLGSLKTTLLQNEGKIDELRDRLSRIENKRGPGRPKKIEMPAKVNDA